MAASMLLVLFFLSCILSCTFKLQFNFFICVFLLDILVLFEIHNLWLFFTTLIEFELPFLVVIDPISNILVAILKLVAPLAMFLIVFPFTLVYITIFIVILTLSVHKAIYPWPLLPCATFPRVLADSRLQTLIEFSSVALLVLSEPSAIAMETAIDKPPFK